MDCGLDYGLDLDWVAIHSMQSYAIQWKHRTPSYLSKSHPQQVWALRMILPALPVTGLQL